MKNLQAVALHAKYYQPEAFAWLTENVRAHQETALLLPTGSGKTTLILSFLAWNFAQETPPFLEAYVVAPLRTIREPFRNGDRQAFCLTPEGPVYTLTRPINLESDGRLDLWIQSTAEQPRWFTGTHQVLAAQAKNLEEWAQVTGDLKGKLLIPDEGHHARRGNRLTAFITYWLAHGGSVLYPTATPKDILHEGVKVFQIPLVELMENRCAPSAIVSRFVDTGLAADVDATTGHEPARYVPKVVNDDQMLQALQTMVESWLADGRPKLIVRIKPTRSSATNARLLLLARQMFQDVGARVLAIRNSRDESEEAFGDSEKLTEALGKERSLKNYSESTCDVFVTMNTMIEGADWPLCSHVYLWGVPDSYPTILQILGRAMRSRTSIEGYPAAWVETSKIVFFVGGVSSGDALNANGRHMLVVGCSLASYSVGSQWSTFREDVRLVRAHPKIRGEVRRNTTAVKEERQTEITLQVTAFVQNLNESFPVGKYERLGGTAAKWQADERKRLFRDLVKGLPPHEAAFAKTALITQCPELRDAYGKAMDRQLTAGQSFDAARSAVLDELLEEFLTLTTLPCGLLEDLERQGALQLTAPVLKEMAQELLRRCPPNLYRSSVANQTRAFIKDHPKMSVEDLLKQPDPQSYDADTFGAYDRAARAGQRGLAQHPDGLASLVCAKYETDWIGRMNDLVLEHRQTKVPLKTIAKGFRHHALGFFYGEALAEVVDKFGVDFCERVTLWQAVQIGRAGWTAQQRGQFLDLLKKVAVQEAIDGFKG